MNGQKLKETREKLGLSQAKLGEWLEVSSNTIARWERGEVPITHPKMLHLAMKAIEIGLSQNSPALKALQDEVAEKMKKLQSIKPGRPTAAELLERAAKK